MPSFTVTPEYLAAIAGALLSVLFSYVPKLNTVFAALDPIYKRLAMLGLLLVTAVGIYALGCGGIITTGIACTRAGVVQLVVIFIMAVIANQAAYQISPQTNAVKLVKPVTLTTASGEVVVPIEKTTVMTYSSNTPPPPVVLSGPDVPPFTVSDNPAVNYSYDPSHSLDYPLPPAPRPDNPGNPA